MDVFKYLPKNIRDRIKKGPKKERLLKVVEHYRDQRDNSLKNEMVALGKLEELLDKNYSLLNSNLNAMYENVGLKNTSNRLEEEVESLSALYHATKDALDASKDLEGMRNTVEYLRLLGPESKLGRLNEEEKRAIAHIIRNGNVNENLVIMIKQLEDDFASLSQKNSELRKGNLVETLATLCHGAGIDRAPVMLYQNNKILYGTDMLEKMVGKYELERSLGRNDKLKIALSRNKKFSIEYDEGKLFFIPEKTKDPDLIVAYYVPNGSKKRRRTFKKFGENAVSTTYKTLRYLRKAGVSINNEEGRNK